MKKVRYMIGAAGALAMTPALGALTTPAASAAVTAHTAARYTTAPVQPLLSSPCDLEPLVATTGTGANTFKGTVLHGGRGVNSCVYGTNGKLSHSQRGLEMRTRLYRNGKQVHQGFVTGTVRQLSGATSFRSFHLNIDATQACEALVYSTKTSKVAYGPVCENI